MEEDLVPKPLRIVKRASAPAPGRRRQPSGISGISYPPIPRRQSSLRVDYRHVSAESGTSTETPPLREGFEQLAIPKKRRSDSGDPERGPVSQTGTTEHPIDRGEPDTQSREASNEYGTDRSNNGFSRIFNTLGFGSWGNLMRHLSMDSAGSADRGASNGPRVPFGDEAANETLDKLDQSCRASLDLKSGIPSVYDQPDEEPHTVDGPTAPGYPQLMDELMQNIDEAMRIYLHGDTALTHDCSTEV